MKKDRSLALFDFDGTISYSDSLKFFLWFYFPILKIILGTIRFLPNYIQYLFGSLNNSTAKEKLFEVFFTLENIQDFNKKCEEFAFRKLPDMLKREALDRIKWHQEQNHEVVVVSASIENYLAPLFNKMDIPVIATKIEVVNNKLTGRFKGENCYGIEKCNRVKKIIKIEDYVQIYVYGDSDGDKEMLKLGTYTFYRTFKY